MNGDDASRYLERQRQTACNVVTAAQTHRRALKDGEWACVDAKCAYINSDRRSACERCGKSKPRSKNRVGREIGKDAAEKSKGLFAAEDWACTKCGNVNWARRTTCNICNAPKLGDLEVRTGYGGGYMDRQNVEYIERKDDDEFDEFGRKKKRKKIDEGHTKQKEEEMNKEEDKKGSGDDGDAEGSQRCSRNDYNEEEEEDEEDEEEEDDDDKALDKYDLSADDFEVEDLKAKIAARKAALAQTAASPDSRCSSDCSCSCSGGECSCEESESEEDRKRLAIKDKEKGKGAEVSRDGRDKGRQRERDRADERERRDEHRNRSRDRSPRRVHSTSSYRDKDRR